MATPRKPRVWFTKAQPGHGESARWMVNWGPTKNGAIPIGYVTCRPGLEGRRSGGYWQGFLLYGQQATLTPVLTREAAGNAVVLKQKESP